MDAGYFPTNLQIILGGILERSYLKNWTIYDDEGIITVKMKFSVAAHMESSEKQTTKFVKKNKAKVLRDNQRAWGYSEKMVLRSCKSKKYLDNIEEPRNGETLNDMPTDLSFTQVEDNHDQNSISHGSLDITINSVDHGSVVPGQASVTQLSEGTEVEVCTTPISPPIHTMVSPPQPQLGVSGGMSDCSAMVLPEIMDNDMDSGENSELDDLPSQSAFGDIKDMLLKLNDQFKNQMEQLESMVVEIKEPLVDKG